MNSIYEHKIWLEYSSFIQVTGKHETSFGLKNNDWFLRYTDNGWFIQSNLTKTQILYKGVYYNMIEYSVLENMFYLYASYYDEDHVVEFEPIESILYDVDEIIWVQSDDDTDECIEDDLYLPQQDFYNNSELLSIVVVVEIPED